MHIFSRLPVLVLACAGLIFAAPALAQVADDGGRAGLVPVLSGDGAEPAGEDTHPLIRLTPDKSELVRLDRDAESVIVGNPAHLGVLMDNRRLLILVPRQPGATVLTVLDGKGDVIMQRHVLVAVPGTDYVRIRRSCTAEAASKGCQTTSVYYCPGMCHEVGIVSGTDSGDVVPVPPAAAVSATSSSSGDDTVVPGDQDVAEPAVDEGDDAGTEAPADSGE